MFVGLYKVQRISSGPVEWPCPLRGGVVGEGRPYDLFETQLMDELSDQIGRLRVAWDPASVRTWIRYAEAMDLPVAGVVHNRNPRDGIRSRSGAGSMGSEELAGALIKRGFEAAHATTKVRLLRRGDLALYVKQGTDRLPLIIHPYFDACLAELGRLAGVELDRPTAYYINSNLREFPVYTAEHRASPSRFGIDLSVASGALDSLLALLARSVEIETSEGRLRRIDTSGNRLTEREQLGLARLGQGAFRSALIGYWNGACAVTGLDQIELLRASHIKPWRSASNPERLDLFNGLLLTPNLDAAFDRGLITFGGAGEAIFSPGLTAENRRRMGIDEMPRLRRLDTRHQAYLEHHREHIFQA